MVKIWNKTNERNIKLLLIFSEGFIELSIFWFGLGTYNSRNNLKTVAIAFCFYTQKSKF